MEKVRIGNDLRVNFSVYRNGEQESFDGATNISTKIVNESYNKTIAHTYSIVGNVIQFNIDALELKQCGKCRVFISYTKDGNYTVDSPAFELVQYTEDTGGTEVIGIEIVKINISGDIGINRDGASAYEVWEAYPGNEGKTIEQYFEWLHENPTKIDLDGLNSNLDKLHFKPDTLVQLANIGDVRYSPESKTLEVKVSDTVSIQLGQEMQTRVKNDEAVQINNGQMVYINSAADANPLAKIASTSNADIAQRTFGMATENIPANGFGAITTEGLVRDINTSAFPEGSMLWLGTNGSVTNIEPVAPVSKISIGMVLRSNANNGVVYVKIRAIDRNQKLSDVYAPTLTGGDILRWNSTTLRFEAFNITSALSTKVDTARTITAGNGLTGGGNLTADRTINVVAADDSLIVAADNIKVNTNNTLTSTSTTQPLSANQGKVLNEKVVQVETNLNALDKGELFDFAEATEITSVISGGNIWVTSGASYLFPILDTSVEFTFVPGVHPAEVAFLTDNSIVLGDIPNYADGQWNKFTGVTKLYCPKNAQYMFVRGGLYKPIIRFKKSNYINSFDSLIDPYADINLWKQIPFLMIQNKKYIISNRGLTNNISLIFSHGNIYDNVSIPPNSKILYLAASDISMLVFIVASGSILNATIEDYKEAQYVEYDDTQTEIGANNVQDAIKFIVENKISVPYATHGTGGIVKVGNNLEIDEEGVLSSVQNTKLVSEFENGLMSASDKVKLNTLSVNATSISVEGSGITKNASAFGFLPTNDGTTNSSNIQSCLNGGGTILVDIPGIYHVNDTMIVGSNTTIIFGSNVFIYVDELANNRANLGHIMANRSCIDDNIDGIYNVDENIHIHNLHVSTHGLYTGQSNKAKLTDAWMCFLHVKNLTIDGYYCSDNMAEVFNICIVDWYNISIRNVNLYSEKDGINLGCGRNLTIRDCEFDCNDDAIALCGAPAYPTNRQMFGDIENVYIENVIIHSPNNGELARGVYMGQGAWLDWEYGEEYQVYGDCCVYGGRVYETISQSGPSIQKIVSVNPPTHPVGTVTYPDGLTWTYKPTNKTPCYNGQLKNITINNITLGFNSRIAYINMESSMYVQYIHQGAESLPVQFISISNVRYIDDITYRNINTHEEVELFVSYYPMNLMLRNVDCTTIMTQLSPIVKIASIAGIRDYISGNCNVIMDGCIFNSPSNASTLLVNNSSPFKCKVKVINSIQLGDGRLGCYLANLVGAGLWVDADVLNIGNSSQRPAYPVLAIKYFDTTLCKYIMHNGINWVNLNGTPI